MFICHIIFLFSLVAVHTYMFNVIGLESRGNKNETTKYRRWQFDMNVLLPETVPGRKDAILRLYGVLYDQDCVKILVISRIETNIQTYICARKHTYIHTYIHTYEHTYIHTCTHTHTQIHTYIHTYMHAYIHTYIHTCMHTYIHKYV